MTFYQKHLLRRLYGCKSIQVSRDAREAADFREFTQRQMDMVAAVEYFSQKGLHVAQVVVDYDG